MDSRIVTLIAQETALPENSVAAVIRLFEEGNSGPYIASYRKEAAGGIDESAIRAVQERMNYYREIQERGASLVKLLTEQGKLTDDLRRRIEDCCDRVEMEDMFHFFRPKKKSRAAEAVEKGLEPLAEYLWHQEPDAWSLEEHADVFIDPEKQVANREQALQGALDIIAEWISETHDLRKGLRNLLWEKGSLVSTVVPAKAAQKTKYNMYYDRKEPVTSIPSHRVLAIRRGTKEGVLTSSIQGDNAEALQIILSSVIRDKDSIFAPFIELAARDSYNRILRPLIETEVRARLKERADREAISVFQSNLENLLLSPPCGRIPAVGVDVGKGEECRLAVIDENGTFLEEAVIPSKSNREAVRAQVLEIIDRRGIQAIVLGSAPGSREFESLLREILADAGKEQILVASVNDAGIAIYASSRIGREELPDLSGSTRTAVSLARRLQDPLLELVKIDPKLIGVGQYQHDVDQKELHRRLVQTVQFAVNRVGVDPNTAGFSLLRYVSGLNDRLARRLIAFRSAGPFPALGSLLSVPGIDEAVYRQAAAFLRIENPENPLDGTRVHPDCYPIAEKMAASLNVSVARILEDRNLIPTLKLQELADETTELSVLQTVRDQLLLSGRDPRGVFTPPKVRTDIRDISDLKEGTTLEGTVTNVTNFGAFVDIGIQQDGLVHLSQMSNRFIRDPREAVKVGDLVRVKVISVEIETKRIGLSMKALLPALPRRRKKGRRRSDGRGAAPPAGSPATAERAPSAMEASAGEDPPAEAVSAQPEPNSPSNRNERPNRNSRSNPRGRKRDVSQEEKPRQQRTAEQEPQEPERSLQEKIAILQSKFRGIN